MPTPSVKVWGHLNEQVILTGSDDLAHSKSSPPAQIEQIEKRDTSYKELQLAKDSIYDVTMCTPMLEGIPGMRGHILGR